MPRWRQVMSLTLLILIGAGFVAYRRLTDEARLRDYAQLWLQDFTGGEAQVEQVRFSLFTGLHLSGVTLATPEAARFDPGDDSLAGRTVFRCASVFLRLRPFSVISGHLVVPEIVVDDPELFLVQRLPDGVGNWDVMLAHRRQQPSDGPPRLPVVRVRNARLAHFRLDDTGRSGGAVQRIRAEAWPVQNQPNVYALNVNKLMEAAGSGEMGGERGRLLVNLRTLAVSGTSLPTVTIDELLFSAPAEVIRWLDVLALRGYVRPDTFSYDPETLGHFKLSLRDASFSIPIDASEYHLPPDQRYLNFSGITGEINFNGRSAQVGLRGRLRDASVVLDGNLMLAGENTGETPVPHRPGAAAGVAHLGLDAIGFDLSLKASGVPLPREDTESEAETRFAQHWHRLRQFIRHFDGKGPVDLTIKLRKAAGPDERLELVEGVMQPRGVSARYHQFPYRIFDMTGTVRILSDGIFELDELAGRHGPGRVRINGWEGGYASQAADITIDAQDIALDDDLRECLSESDQELCRRFNAEAMMNLRVHMTRADRPPGTPDNPWRTAIDVEFTEGSASFDGFPYPMGDLAGRMRIAGGGFEIHELRAGRGPARLRVSGSASRGGQGSGGFDLCLEVADVPFDEVLAAALPPSIRAMYGRLDPAGSFSLSGHLVQQPGDSSLDYDLTAAIQSAELTLPMTSARVHDAEGRLRLQPAGVSVESLAASFGESPVSLRGDVAVREDEPSYDFQLASDRLALDDRLREVLPDGLHTTWDMFKPSGTARLELRMRSRDHNAAPAAQAEASLAGAAPAFDYKLDLELTDCSAIYTGFPLPLTHIHGSLTAVPGRVTLRNFTARHDESPLTLSGQVNTRSDGTRVQLALDARRMPLSEELRRAVPWRLRRAWNEVSPKGRFDLSLPELSLTSLAGEPARGEFKGSIRLDEVSLMLGPGLTDISGEVKGSGRMGPGFALDARSALSTIRVDGRLMTDVTAGLTRGWDEHIFQVEDLIGNFYGGQILGTVEVKYGERQPGYGVSLTARGVSLSAFLNDGRQGPEEEGVSPQGTVEGNLAFTGRLGMPKSRQGGGGVVIREAQMLKVPLMLSILQVINFATDDDNAFHDAAASFTLDGDTLILDEIDLRGRALSMVGAGTVHLPDERLDLAFLIGSPMRLPRFQVLTELVEGVARELMEVRVEGTLSKPTFRAEVVRTVKKTLDTILGARGRQDRR